MEEEEMPKKRKKDTNFIFEEKSPFSDNFMEDETPDLNDEFKFTVMRPTEIKEELDKYIIGQDDAKKVLSVAVYNHYKRIFNNKANPNSNPDWIPWSKSNIMLLGPTGCGKTLMVKTIAKMLNVPCYIADCTSITEAGYVGNDIESLLTGLLHSCNYKVKMAEMGIVYCDEIDKIARKSQSTSITRDVSGEGVQQGLLKIVEGNLVGIPPQGGRIHPHQELIMVNTTNILFIGSGAFSGIDTIIKRRLGGNSIGFNKEEKAKEEIENYIDFVSPEDIREFGFIPEFVGRFPVITHVNNLSKEDLIRILTQPKDAIVKEYTQMFALDGCALSFTEEALEEVADIALKEETGARGLRNIMEMILMDYMFEAPSCGLSALIITPEIVREKVEKRIKYSKSA